MENKPNHTIETILIKVQEEGKKWVAFEGFELPDSVWGMHFFQSAIEAGAFCSDNHFRRDPEDGELIDQSYLYYPIENLIAECRQVTGPVPDLPAMLKSIEAFLHLEDIEPAALDQTGNFSLLLALGRVAAASKTVVITPLEWIAPYHIVEHRHQSAGLIYELGHSHRVLDSYSNLADARSAFEALAKEMPCKEERAFSDLLLVGQFKDQEFQLDIEGYPEYGCGMAITQAWVQNKALIVHQICDPALKTAVEQRFFIRLNNTSDGLSHLDDRLNGIVPGSSLQSFYDSNFRAVFNVEQLSVLKDHLHKVAPKKLQLPGKRFVP